MPLDGEYVPSASEWVANQVAEYEGSKGARGNVLGDTDMRVVVVTTRGAKSHKVRKFALMRVEHDGEYALVASKGGTPENPDWYWNLKKDPTALTIQDGPEPHDMIAREVTGAEKDLWWSRAVAAYPPYEDYQKGTQRQIPVFVAHRAGRDDRP